MSAPRPDGPAKRERADVLLVDRGLAPTRQKAQALILAGEVFSGEARIDKPGVALRTDSELRVSPRRRFVSRGGEKLDGALEDLASASQLRALDGRVAVDVGASTGGFTDCLLQRGAARVYAVDVGTNQLDARLRADPRVVVRDQTNARDLEASAFDERIDLVVVDASFIGLGLLMPAIARVLPAGDLLALVKPQFEAGKAEVSKGKGVIRDEATRERAIDGARDAVREAGFEILSEADSRLRGPKGNLERFLHAVRKR